MPRIGLGTWPLDDDAAEVAVAEGIRNGYRLIDTAYNYGNERGVGAGLRASGVPREALFVTTKLNAEDHGVDEAQRAFERSAERLGLDHIDLLLIHWPNPAQDRYVDAYRGLLRLLEDGRIRAVGLSNFKPHHIDRLLDETGVVPDVNQIELDPTVARIETRAYLLQQGITVESWSPIGAGGDLLSRPAIRRIADARDRTPAQIVLRWHVQQELVPIPKSADPQRQRENLDVFGFELSDGEMAEPSRLDQGEDGVTDSDRFGH